MFKKKAGFIYYRREGRRGGRGLHRNNPQIGGTRHLRRAHCGKQRRAVPIGKRADLDNTFGATQPKEMPESPPRAERKESRGERALLGRSPLVPQGFQPAPPALRAASTASSCLENNREEGDATRRRSGAGLPVAGANAWGRRVTRSAEQSPRSVSQRVVPRCSVPSQLGLARSGASGGRRGRQRFLSSRACGVNNR